MKNEHKSQAENRKATPKPGSADYNVEETEKLTTPQFHSSTDRRNSAELPATENLDDQKEIPQTIPDSAPSEPNLGNKRSDDENEREKLITP